MKSYDDVKKLSDEQLGQLLIGSKNSGWGVDPVPMYEMTRRLKNSMGKLNLSTTVFSIILILLSVAMLVTGIIQIKPEILKISEIVKDHLFCR